MAEYEAFSSDAVNDTAVPCNVCQRTFRPETLIKHEKICAKASNSRRKVFQSGKQRAQGSDVPINKVLKSGAIPEKSKPSRNKSDWRQQHEQFIQGLKAARGVTLALASGKPLPPPPPPALNPDYVQCPSCSRRFNETAAERHISFCKEKNKRIPDKKTVDPSAQRRKDARLNYKTAKPKIKGREDTMYSSSPTGNGLEANGYSAPMRTGKTDRILNDSLNRRSGSLDRRKGSQDSGYSGLSKRVNSHEIITRTTAENGYEGYYSPSPPGPGRPPSGASYQHRSREGSGKLPTSALSGRGYDSGIGAPAQMNGSGDRRYRTVRHSTNAVQKPSSASKFCHECGNKFCRVDAKFCCECGLERMVL